MADTFEAVGKTERSDGVLFVCDRTYIAPAYAEVKTEFAVNLPGVVQTPIA